MSDLICRKTLMRCQTPGMCSPYGGCQPQPVTESVFKTDYARLEQECERVRDENALLRAGMKGDYDLDAWLEWVREKSAMLRQETALLTDARQQLYQAFISRENEQELKAMIDRIDARLIQCRSS